MIKLEDLKTGDKIYGVDSDETGLYLETIVNQGLAIIEIPKPTEAVWCTGGIELLTRSYEKYIFRTEKEAEDCLNKIRFELAKDLVRSDRFIDRLFECATSSKRLNKCSEYPIYKIALEIYKMDRRMN
jgi:hypothetical protein